MVNKNWICHNCILLMQKHFTIQVLANIAYGRNVTSISLLFSLFSLQFFTCSQKKCGGNSNLIYFFYVQFFFMFAVRKSGGGTLMLRACTITFDKSWRTRNSKHKFNTESWLKIYISLSLVGNETLKRNDK